MAPFWSRALSMSVPRNCIAVGALCTTLPARICPAVNASGLRREVPDKQPRTCLITLSVMLGAFGLCFALASTLLPTSHQALMEAESEEL